MNLEDMQEGGSSDGSHTLMVQGDQVEKAWLDGSIDKAASVVVHRCSPGDKALIVKKVMEQGAFTLAIGDGANDVNMIQTASIGIGIMGKEGN